VASKPCFRDAWKSGQHCRRSGAHRHLS
jgi:hypothetical protein